MAFDLAVFNKQVYTALTETVDQQVQLFNEASGGSIMLMPGSGNAGDYAMRASFKTIGNMVRRRDVNNGTNTVGASRLQHLQNVAVKVAAGTPPIEFEAAQFNWIQQNPAQAALVIGEQLAKATMQDMLNTAIAGAVAATSGVPALNYATGDPLTFADLVKGAGKFGDRMGSLAAWVMHSKSMTDLYSNAVQNGQRLFEYGTVNVVRDPFGRLLIMSDSPALVDGSAYKVLGLVNGGVMVEQNGDFDANMTRANGKENIQSSYQAEWSYNLGLFGYAWNTSAGGKAPSNAALATAANWTKTATSNKDTAGVLITSGTTGGGA